MVVTYIEMYTEITILINFCTCMRMYSDLSTSLTNNMLTSISFTVFVFTSTEAFWAVKVRFPIVEDVLNKLAAGVWVLLDDFDVGVKSVIPLLSVILVARSVLKFGVVNLSVELDCEDEIDKSASLDFGSVSVDFKSELLSGIGVSVSSTWFVGNGVKSK